MHKRFARFAVGALLVIALPGVAAASSARLDGMNVPGDYTKDYTGIFSYASGINSVGNLVYVEPGSEDADWGDRAVGAVLTNLWDGRFGTWGINLREMHPALGQPTWAGQLNPGNLGFDPNTNNPGEAFDLMWGHKMGGSTLGLRLNRTFQSTDVSGGGGSTEGNGNNGRNILGVGAGLGFDLNPQATGEIGALFQNRGFDAGGGVKDDGGTDYQVAGRLFWKGGNNVVWVPAAKVWAFDQSTQAGAAKTENQISGWQIGMAGNWAVNNNDLLVVGVQFAGNHQKLTPPGGPTTNHNETFYPNVFIGLETQVNSWLTLRAGAQNAMFFSDRVDNGTVTTTDKEMRFNFNMGAGMKLGQLQLDATLDPLFASNPVGQLVGGSNAIFSGETPFPHVTATYSF